MPVEQLTETEETTYSGWMTSLLPLKDNAFQLAPFGEIEITGRKANGVAATRVCAEPTAQAVSEEYTYSDFKTVEGTPQAMKMSIQRNGKPYAAIGVDEFKLSENLDGSVFAKP